MGNSTDVAGFLDNDYGKFPRYLNLIPDVFSFSYEELLKAAARFRTDANLSQAFETLLEFILASELPEEQKETLAQLISEEMEVISYAVISRTCVVSI